MERYIVDGQIYKVKPENIEIFLQRFPTAQKISQEQNTINDIRNAPVIRKSEVEQEYKPNGFEKGFAFMVDSATEGFTDTPATDWWVGRDGDARTALYNGKLRANAFDGINDVFGLSEDDYMTEEQAEKFQKSLNSMGSMKEVQSFKQWQFDYDEILNKYVDQSKDSKEFSPAQQIRGHLAAAVGATTKNGPGAMMGVMLESLRGMGDMDIIAPGITTAGGVFAKTRNPLMSLAAGWGAMNYQAESINTFSELVREELGEDISTENILKLFNDKEKIDELETRSRLRGGVIALSEAGGAVFGGKAAGIVSKQVSKKVGTSLPGRLAAGTAGVGAAGAVEMPASFVGEIGGQVVAGQDIDIKEGVVESLASIGTAAISGPLGMGRSILQSPSYKIGGKNVTRQDILKSIKHAKDSDLLSQYAANVEIKNDPVLKEMFNNRFLKSAIKLQVDKRITNESDRNDITELELEKRKLKNNETHTAKLRLKEIETEIENIRNQYSKTGRLTREAQAIRDKQADLMKSLGDVKFKRGLEFAKEYSSLYNLTVDDSMTVEEIRNEFGETAAKSSGLVDPESNRIIINTEVAKTKGISGANVGNHELLHGILNASGIKIKKSMVTEFLNIIGSDAKAKILERKKIYGKDWNDQEYFTIYSDMSADPNFEYNSNVFDSLKDYFRRLFQDLGVKKVDFKDMNAKGMYNFIRDYNRSIHKGVLSKGLIKQGEGKGKSKQFSLSMTGSQNINDIYNTKGIEGGWQDMERLLKPTAKGLANRYRNVPGYNQTKDILVDEILTGPRGMFDVIMDYDTKKKAGQDMGELSGYINNSFSTKTGFKRYIEIANRILGEEFTTDITEVKDIAV